MRKEDVLEIERQQKLHEMKAAVHSRYSSIAPSIFLKKWEQQSFHDIGERALRKKSLETLPADIFLFLYENYSPVSGTDVFAILTSYIYSDQMFPSEYYSQVVQAVSASDLAEDDFYPVIDLAIGMMEGSETIELGLNIMDCLASKKWPKPVSSHFKQYAIKEYLRYCDHSLISSNQAIASLERCRREADVPSRRGRRDSRKAAQGAQPLVRSGATQTARTFGSPGRASQSARYMVGRPCIEVRPCFAAGFSMPLQTGSFLLVCIYFSCKNLTT